MRRTVNRAGGAATVTLFNTDASREHDLPGRGAGELKLGPDPRFGMLAASPDRARVVPGGQTETLTAQRSVSLTDPANLLSLQNWPTPSP